MPNIWLGIVLLLLTTFLKNRPSSCVDGLSLCFSVVIYWICFKHCGRSLSQWRFSAPPQLVLQYIVYPSASFARTIVPYEWDFCSSFVSLFETLAWSACASGGACMLICKKCIATYANDMCGASISAVGDDCPDNYSILVFSFWKCVRGFVQH